jgi:hypothetical protein
MDFIISQINLIDSGIHDEDGDEGELYQFVSKLSSASVTLCQIYQLLGIAHGSLNSPLESIPISSNAVLLMNIKFGSADLLFLAIMWNDFIYLNIKPVDFYSPDDWKQVTTAQFFNIMNQSQCTLSQILDFGYIDNLPNDTDMRLKLSLTITNVVGYSLKSRLDGSVVASPVQPAKSQTLSRALPPFIWDWPRFVEFYSTLSHPNRVVLKEHDSDINTMVFIHPFTNCIIHVQVPTGYQAYKHSKSRNCASYWTLAKRLCIHYFPYQIRHLVGVIRMDDNSQRFYITSAIGGHPQYVAVSLLTGKYIILNNYDEVDDREDYISKPTDVEKINLYIQNQNEIQNHERGE